MSTEEATPESVPLQRPVRRGERAETVKQSKWKLIAEAWRVGAANRGRFGHLKTAGALLSFFPRVALNRLSWLLISAGQWLHKKTRIDA